ncbi:Protein OSB1, mitochondrial [Dichanthelium oligosanthes]|uniref:Protein OSB1, mitochondrial n=1 Tax=Dichanthelium oligosanthes TaxID=888268 RepID=A0A1E5VYK6_9POAL|nr:Protein OSB1, mitochondrial [Dichanthelium oligosanthes]
MGHDGLSDLLPNLRTFDGEDVRPRYSFCPNPTGQMQRLLAGRAATVRWPPPAAALRRLLHTGGGSGGGGGDGESESVAYRMSMLRCPSSVGKKGLTWNSCTLIGRLNAPVRPCDSSSDEDPRAYTFLSVSPSSPVSSSSSSKFTLSPSFSRFPHPISNPHNLDRVALKLKGELANVGLKHLKHNDFVYVSGFLKSYHKVSPSGDRNIVYQIHVTELNYVLDQNKKPQDDKDSVHPSLMLSATPQMLKEKRYIDRLHLWQVFFANPYEWWDNRQSKRWANYPDFKHKDTHEKIWLQPDDPPWVRKQLELHDLEVVENGHKGNGRLLKNHDWKAQDFDYSDDEEVLHSAEA